MVTLPAAANIRNALRARLEADGTATLIEEFWVPRSNERADLVAIGDAFDAFEIKSARDRLNRLPRQVAAYGRLFDSCTAVIAEHHAAVVAETLPDWWGVAVIRPSGTLVCFEWLRRANPNPYIDVETLVRLLWRAEVHQILERLGAGPAPRQSRAAMWRELLGLVDSQALRELVRKAIATRDPSQARIPTRRFSTRSAPPVL